MPCLGRRWAGPGRLTAAFFQAEVWWGMPEQAAMLIVENDPNDINSRLRFTIRDMFVKDQFIGSHDQTVTIPRPQPDEQDANVHRFFWYWLVVDNGRPAVEVTAPDHRPVNRLHKFLSAIGTVQNSWQPSRIYQQDYHVEFNAGWELELEWNLEPETWYRKDITSFAPTGALAYLIWRPEVGRSPGAGPGFAQWNSCMTDNTDTPPNAFCVQHKGYVPHDGEPYLVRDVLPQPVRRDQTAIWMGTHSTPTMVSVICEGYILTEYPLTNHIQHERLPARH